MLLLDIGEVCNDLAVLRVIRFIKSLLDVIRIMVPVILTILCMIDFFKALLANEDTKVTSKIVKRFLSAIIIFFIIPVINLFFGMLGESNVNASDCWNNANDSNIEVLAAKEELEKQTKLNEAEAKRKAKEAQKMEESKSVASQGESTGDGDGATSSNIGGYIYYNQGDYSNVGFCKNGKTVKSSGCSAVSFAMVASNLVSSNSNPKSVANWMCSNIHDNGALVADKLINNQLLNQYGLKGERIFGNIGQSQYRLCEKTDFRKFK